MKNINTQSSQPQAPLSSLSSTPVPQQINTQQQSPIVQSRESKHKSKLTKKFLIIGTLFLLTTIVFGYSVYRDSKDTINKEASPEKTAVLPETVPAGWKVNECIYDGYKISHPADITPHNVFPGDKSCFSQYGYSGLEEPISVHTYDQRISDDKNHSIKSEKDLTINGIDVRYLEIEMLKDEEAKKFLVYEYPGNGKYYRLLLNLDYHSPRQDLDFYRDTQWEQMVDEYNKAQVGSDDAQITQIDIEDIFHKMAQTFVLTTPESIPVSELEICLKTAQKNFDDNEMIISKPTGAPNTYFYTKEEYDIIYLQYKTEVNLCYRTHKEKGMKDCFKLYPDNPSKEYDCNFHNIAPVIMRQKTGLF